MEVRGVRIDRGRRWPAEVEATVVIDEDGMSEDRLDYDRLPPLPGGFKLCKIRVNHSVDMGQANGIQGLVTKRSSVMNDFKK
jgi:hypothetical protein